MESVERLFGAKGIQKGSEVKIIREIQGTCRGREIKYYTFFVLVIALMISRTTPALRILKEGGCKLLDIMRHRFVT